MAGIPSEYKNFIGEFLNPLLAGTCVNAFLFGVTACWQWQYWKSSYQDPLLLRLCVAIILISDTLGCVGVITMLQAYVVQGFGDVFALWKLGWHWNVMVVTSGVSAFISQSFLTYRVHRFTKRLWVSIPLYTGAVAAFGTNIWVAVTTTRYTDPSGHDNLQDAITGWTAAVIAVNVLLCMAVVGFLLRLSRYQYIHTKNLVRRLMFTALYTGLGLVALEAACLITYLTAYDTNAPTFFMMTLGRAYSLVLLINLNHRYSDDPNTQQKNPSFVRSTDNQSTNPGFIKVQIPELSKIRTRDVVRRGSDQASVMSQAGHQSPV